MSGKTVRLCEGKYVFELSDQGLLVEAWRKGVLWPAGMELRHTNCFVAALDRVAELERCANDVADALAPLAAVADSIDEAAANRDAYLLHSLVEEKKDLSIGGWRDDAPLRLSDAQRARDVLRKLRGR